MIYITYMSFLGQKGRICPELIAFSLLVIASLALVYMLNESEIVLARGYF